MVMINGTRLSIVVERRSKMMRSDGIGRTKRIEKTNHIKMRIHPSQTCIKQRDLNMRDQPRANEKVHNDDPKAKIFPHKSPTTICLDAWIAIMIVSRRGWPALIRLDCGTAPESRSER
jgi:hypothetical protein